METAASGAGIGMTGVPAAAPNAAKTRPAKTRGKDGHLLKKLSAAAKPAEDEIHVHGLLVTVTAGYIASVTGILEKMPGVTVHEILDEERIVATAADVKESTAIETTKTIRALPGVNMAVVVHHHPGMVPATKI